MRAARPTARRASAASVNDGVFWMFGGFGTGGTVNPWDVGSDLWFFTEGEWTLVSEKVEPGARYPALFFSGDHLYRFGGCGWDAGSVTFEDRLWRLDRGARAWVELPRKTRGPAGRYTAAAFSHEGAIYVFGGHSQTPMREKTNYGDLWRYEGGYWDRLHDEEVGPGRRYGFGWCVSEDSLFVATGFDGVTEKAETWRLDLAELSRGESVWERLPEGPDARFCPSLGIVDGMLVLFGGRKKRNPNHHFSDTWLFDLGEQSWRRFAGTEPKYHAKSAYASDGRRLFVFGGEGATGHVSDLWTFDKEGWRQLESACSNDPSFW